VSDQLKEAIAAHPSFAFRNVKEIRPDEIIPADSATCPCGAPLALYVFDARLFHCSALLLGTEDKFKPVYHVLPCDTANYAFQIGRRKTQEV
jgi:hypothetical protein